MKLLRQVTTTRENCFAEGVRPVCGSADGLFELPAEREVIWRGFGACLNEAGIAALDTLPPACGRRILDELFLPVRLRSNEGVKSQTLPQTCVSFSGFWIPPVRFRG